MINPRIKLLLDPQFIRFSSDSYQWALDAEKEYQTMSESKRADIDCYRRGVRYIDTAMELINVEFKDVLKAENLRAVVEADAKRSWLIVHRSAAIDPLGLAYTWFITRISLYVPDRRGHIHHPIPESLDHTGVIDHLFRQFLSWADTNNYLSSLSPNPEHPAFIDEIEGLFATTVEVLTASNPYVKQIFKDNNTMETSITFTQELDKAEASYHAPLSQSIP